MSALNYFRNVDREYGEGRNACVTTVDAVESRYGRWIAYADGMAGSWIAFGASYEQTVGWAVYGASFGEAADSDVLGFPVRDLNASGIGERIASAALADDRFYSPTGEALRCILRDDACVLDDESLVDTRDYLARIVETDRDADLVAWAVRAIGAIDSVLSERDADRRIDEATQTILGSLIGGLITPREAEDAIYAAWARESFPLTVRAIDAIRADVASAAGCVAITDEVYR